MNKPAHEDDEQGEIFLDESDIIQEVDVDEEGLSPPPSLSLSLSLQLHFPSDILLLLLLSLSGFIQIFLMRMMKVILKTSRNQMIQFTYSPVIPVIKFCPSASFLCFSMWVSNKLYSLTLIKLTP